jgi:hypothetical protein
VARLQGLLALAPAAADGHALTSAVRWLFRQLRDSPIELGDRLPELLLAGVMRGSRQLPLHLRAREAERFQLARPLRVARGYGQPPSLFFLFSLFHPLREPRFRVDKAFSSVTHDH